MRRRRPPNEAEDIRSAVADAGAALDRGDPDAAAERFIDYWMGAGSWRRMPGSRQAPIRESVTNVRRWGHALFSEATPLAAFRTLEMPVLYMLGSHSTASAKGVARLLTRAGAATLEPGLELQRPLHTTASAQKQRGRPKAAARCRVATSATRARRRP